MHQVSDDLHLGVRDPAARDVTHAEGGDAPRVSTVRRILRLPRPTADSPDPTQLPGHRHQLLSVSQDIRVTAGDTSTRPR